MLRRFVLGRSPAVARAFAALSVVAVGTALALTASAGANSGRQTRAALAKLPPQARSAVRRDDTVRGRTYFDGLGIRPGKIKHVWLIILENKSYDASFTGLNDNT